VGREQIFKLRTPRLTEISSFAFIRFISYSPRDDFDLVSPRSSSPKGLFLRTTLPPDPAIGEHKRHQVVVQDYSRPIQRDPTTQSDYSGPSPKELGAQSSNQSALPQLAFAASAVPVEEDDGEIVSQKEAIQQSPMVASRTAPVKRPRGRPRKHPIQKPVSQLR
jgi:hypothetical protein